MKTSKDFFMELREAQLMENKLREQLYNHEKEIINHYQLLENEHSNRLQDYNTKKNKHNETRTNNK